MARVHNFSAGPAALPTSVLTEIADEMMDYRGCGMSVLEMSHRSSMYQQIIDDAEATLRRLLSIPDNYHVLFLQGGATLQFAGIPMNLMRRGRAGYVVTGNFANKAYKEAAKYGEAVLLASSEDTNFDRIPDMADVNARIAAEAAGDGSTTPTSPEQHHLWHHVPRASRLAAMCRWSPMSRAAFCRSRSTSSATGSSTPARRKTPAPRA